MPYVSNYRAIYYHIDGFIDYSGSPGIYSSAGTPLIVVQNIALSLLLNVSIYISDVSVVLPTEDIPIINEDITAVNTGTQTFTIAGDYTASLTVNKLITVLSSTSNDGTYTVVSSSLVSGNTEIIVSETIPDGTVDGRINTMPYSSTAMAIPAFDTTYLAEPAGFIVTNVL